MDYSFLTFYVHVQHIWTLAIAVLCYFVCRVILRSPHVGNQLLTRNQYKQMVGRAGRSGLCERGESILIVRDRDKLQVETPCLAFNINHSLFVCARVHVCVCVCACACACACACVRVCMVWEWALQPHFNMQYTPIYSNGFLELPGVSYRPIFFSGDANF